jgi:hypothetical protein
MLAILIAGSIASITYASHLRCWKPFFALKLFAEAIRVEANLRCFYTAYAGWKPFALDLLRPFPALKVILRWKYLRWKPSMEAIYAEAICGASHLLGSYLLLSSHVGAMCELSFAGGWISFAHMHSFTVLSNLPARSTHPGRKEPRRSSFVARSIWLSHIR